MLINNLLLPWLPSAVSCGTGIIVDHEQRIVDAGQDDIIVFDQLLAPSILEVKSKLTKADLTAFVQKSKAIAELKLATRPGQDPRVFGA